MENDTSLDSSSTMEWKFPFFFSTLMASFSLHSVLRLLAADTFNSWLFSLPTMVDIFTLPALFLSVWLKRTWIGFRYIRFCMFVELPDVLVYVRLLQKSTSIRLAQLSSKIFGFFLAAAGLVYLLENQGDPHHDYSNARQAGEMREGST